jgi:hypothetical protein
MKQFLDRRKHGPPDGSVAKQTKTLSSSPAEVARARKLAKARTWEDRFEFFLREDELAQDVFNRILRQGVLRHHLIAFLEAATDPQTGERLQRLLPCRGEAQTLIGQLQKTAKQLRSFWERPTVFTLALTRERAAALSTAETLDAHAKVLGEIRWDVIAKMMGYKTFWSQLPIAILCWILLVPVLVPFVDLSRICATALRVRSSFGLEVKPKGFSPRALGATYSRFCRREAGRRFMESGGLETIAGLLIAALPK